MSETTINEPKLQLPLLLTDGFFLFPKCNYSLPKEKVADLGAIQNLDNFYSVGTWGKIILDLTYEADAELVINSLQEIQLEGLERVQITNPQKPEQNRDEKVLTKLTEKFIAYLPSILKKTNLDFAEKFHYLAMSNLGNFIDFLAQISQEMPRHNKQAILASVHLPQRLDYLLEIPPKENEQKSVDKDINSRVNSEAKKDERVYRLRKIISEAQKELQKLEGSDTGNWEQKHLQRLEKEPFPQEVKTVVREQIGQLKTMPPHFGEAHIILTPENPDLEQAKKILDQEHFGLEKIKKTIDTQLAVIQHTGKVAGRIICFAGPPGVGKTSLAKSIAKAMGRKFARISVGGIRDVAVILGFRRTYVGSMPGRIIQAFKKVGVKNPVILLDEVDKINNLSGYQGDPSSALLEVLDPEQNKNFVDHYLEIPFDCSQAFFICTANYLWNIPKALRDRMEIVSLSSYTSIEKLAIAKNYLIPKNLAEHKLEPSQIIFLEQSIEFIINHYVRESGVRELNRLIKKIIQIFIKDLVQKKVKKLPVKITPKLIQSEHYLGKIIYDFTRKEEKSQTGLVHGLAWTDAGGDILCIQVICSQGEEEKGKLTKPTGHLGEVMKESVEVAFKYVKKYITDNYEKFEKLGINLKVLRSSDIDIHVPEGATPKDGPSAGITITTAILSALTKQAIPNDVGMTGEIDLLGNVLPIGGLREKAIAAHRSGLKTIFIPQKNEKDLEEIPAEIKKDLTIILVKEYEQIWEHLFPSVPTSAAEEKACVSPAA
ncbi:3478_t:CDS:2 [Entrophospora sp. SA101]|nr:370_t:CDS:2 [Entrophospora sp. SA101]CAJ0747239.1 3478_t:CDS:2 [Entrophospora sp. SA101]CAJ0842974.1 13693_t:CDS:2 [Entrophospora sp. SA101]